MKGKALAITIWILAIVDFVLLLIAHFNSDIYWIRDCAALCSVLMAVCVIIQSIKSKRSGEDIDKKKLVIGIVLVVVLTLVAVWIILIKTLKVGLE